MSFCYFASDEILMSKNCRKHCEGTLNGVDLFDWKIQTNRCKISNESVLNHLINELNPSKDEGRNHKSIVVNGSHLQLPEMLFGESFVRISNQNDNFCIELNALSALKEWVDKHLKGNFEVIKVPESKFWNEKVGKGIKLEEYDWTWDTPFIGLTFFTSKEGILVSHWESCNESSIDYDMLKDSACPILFFHEVPFYDDFIHDHGEVHMSSKIRVMENCWFLLLRYWLRVHKVLIKVSDVRYFHKFGQNEVFREISHIKVNYEEATKFSEEISILKADEIYSLFKDTKFCNVTCERLDMSN
eukprot:CAMPEP_0171471262 /NCGR_PEP_ID=MMETSP0946-20130122/601_1 /TAXON_ID=109269 /ORGANISM="Vaucheria litorea, Strain CCMP2940" /LENGTH=300 /DNA_ID=CAMNT_0012000721 /DNA_START=12 /DNA_END=914 /DNA_ORIENTATION=-